MTTAASRNRYAAVLLLAPLAAALFAANPANAQVYAQVYTQVLPSPPAYVAEAPYGHYGRYARQDRRGPEIFDVTPTDGSRVFERGRTTVTARVGDNRSGIDYSSVRMRVDGRDVTYRTRVDNDEVRYRDDFTPGRHVAELSVRDRAGNWSTRAWSFDIVERGWGHRYSYYDR